MHAYQVAGIGQGGPNLTVVNRANSLEDLLSAVNEYDEFIEKTIDIRTPETLAGNLSNSSSMESIGLFNINRATESIDS